MMINLFLLTMTILFYVYRSDAVLVIIFDLGLDISNSSFFLFQVRMADWCQESNVIFIECNVKLFVNTNFLDLISLFDYSLCF